MLHCLPEVCCLSCAASVMSYKFWYGLVVITVLFKKKKKKKRYKQGGSQGIPCCRHATQLEAKLVTLLATGLSPSRLQHLCCIA